jgi:hypothetical protein
MTVDPKFTKNVSSTAFVNIETKEKKTLQGSELKWTLCSRLDLNDKKGNFFSSFNIPPTPETLVYKPITATTEFDVASIVFAYPELLQFNVDNFLFAKIPSSGYSEFIDGRSFVIRIPHTGSSSSSVLSSLTIYSSLYKRSENQNHDNSPLLGDNIAYLFCDDINKPYSGLTINEIGQYKSLVKNKTWNPNSNNYNERPYAISYNDVVGNDVTLSAVDTDKRSFVNWAVPPPANFPDKKGNAYRFNSTFDSGGNLSLSVPSHGIISGGFAITLDMDNKDFNFNYNTATTLVSVLTANTLKTGIPFGTSAAEEFGSLYIGNGIHYNYDIPIGFVILDKGYIIITHPYIINRIPWSFGFKDSSSFSYSSVSAATDIYWSGLTSSGLQGNYAEYYDVNKVFKITTSCLALNNEFYVSSNKTWDTSRILNSSLGNPQPVQITEIGFYNAMGETVAVAKFSEPVQKTFDDIMGFEISVEL